MRLSLNRCHVRLEHPAAQTSLLAMGGFFFLRVLLYFGLRDLSDTSAGALIGGAILPMLLSGAYLVLVRFLRFAKPLPFCIGAAAVCGILAFRGFAMGNVVLVFLHTMLLLLGGAAIVGMFLGVVPKNVSAFAPLAAAVALRVIAYDLPHIAAFGDLQQLTDELSTLCLMIWVCCIPLLVCPEAVPAKTAQ